MFEFISNNIANIIIGFTVILIIFISGKQTLKKVKRGGCDGCPSQNKNGCSTGCCDCKQ